MSAAFTRIVFKCLALDGTPLSQDWWPKNIVDNDQFIFKKCKFNLYFHKFMARCHWDWNLFIFPRDESTKANNAQLNGKKAEQQHKRKYAYLVQRPPNYVQTIPNTEYAQAYKANKSIFQLLFADQTSYSTHDWGHLQQQQQQPHRQQRQSMKMFRPASSFREIRINKFLSSKPHRKHLDPQKEKINTCNRLNAIRWYNGEREIEQRKTMAKHNTKLNWIQLN